MVVVPAALVRAVPVEPDADEGRRLLVDELGKTIYQDARPTPFDLVAKAIGDWIASLLAGAGSTGGNIGLALILVVVAALIVVAFLVFGRPRLERRGRRSTALFGENDVRTADQMRGAARSAAADEDWDTAAMEMFRAVARGLAERTLVDVNPGTTATGFARAATVRFPDRSAPLADAAHVFDSVRYLGGHADRADFDALTTLDADLAAARPLLAESPPSGSGTPR